MGNAAAGGLEQESAEHSVGGTTAMSDPVPTLQKKQSAPALPMPPEEELEKRFDAVLVSGFGVLKKTGGADTHFLHIKSDVGHLLCYYKVSYKSL